MLHNSRRVYILDEYGRQKRNADGSYETCEVDLAAVPDDLKPGFALRQQPSGNGTPRIPVCVSYKYPDDCSRRPCPNLVADDASEVETLSSMRHVRAYSPRSSCVATSLKCLKLCDGDRPDRRRTLSASTASSNCDRLMRPGAESKRYWEKDNAGDTSLHNCLMCRETVDEIVAVIDRVPDPRCLDIRNGRGLTPIHLAVCMDRPEIVEQLLKAGASMKLVEYRYCDTPALMACRLGRDACLSAIVEAIERRVTEACCLNERCNVQDEIFAEFRSVLQATDKEGQSCLLVAYAYKHRTIVHSLIHNYKVDVNQIEAKRDMTLLHYAARQNDVELVKELVELPNIDVKMLTSDGYTAYEMALDGKHDGVAAILQPRMATQSSDEEEEMKVDAEE